MALTYSPSDRALANYTLMYGPPLGSVGAGADLAPAIPARHAVMIDAVQSYDLTPGTLLSVDARAFVDEGAGGLWDVVGSHMDIADDPVSHLVWEGVLADVPSTAYAAVVGPSPAGGGAATAAVADGGWDLGRAVGSAGAAAGGAALAAAGGAALAAGHAVGGAVGGATRVVGGVLGGGAAAIGSVAGASWRALRWMLPPY